jgi:hypothetical protein
VKPLIILLALVGVIFFVVLASSSANNANRAPHTLDDRRQLARSYQPAGLVTGVGSLLGRWAPKVRFERSSLSVTGAPVTVAIARDDDHTFRRALIRVAPPHCASVRITYKSTDAQGSDLQLDRQTWEGTSQDPCAGSLVVQSKGGTLTFECPLSQTCAISFE